MSKKAVLVIHGFGANTKENEYLVTFLRDKHYFDVYDFILPGHDKKIVRKVKHEEWIDESKKQLESLIKKYNDIYLIGHSMGGVIASYLATQYKEVKKLVLLAPSFNYLNFTQNRKDIKKIYTLKSKEYKIEYKEALYQEVLPKMIRLPLTTMIEFIKLVSRYKKYPIDIKCPTLILHGDEDELIPISSSEYVFDKIKGNHKYLTIIEHAKHRLLLCNKKQKISIYINSFLKGGLLWIIKKKSKI